MAMSRNFFFLTLGKLNGILNMSRFNRVESLLIPPEFQWMSLAKHLQDAGYLGIVIFCGHLAHLILAPRLLMGVPEVKSVQRLTHYSRIKRPCNVNLQRFRLQY